MSSGRNKDQGMGDHVGNIGVCSCSCFDTFLRRVPIGTSFRSYFAAEVHCVTSAFVHWGLFGCGCLFFFLLVEPGVQVFA